MSSLEDLFIKISLLEIATIKKYPHSANINGNGDVIGVHYKLAYGDALERRYPFRAINWGQMPFLDFSVLRRQPPKKLRMNHNTPEFDDIGTIDSWGAFIDSFRQLRNNLVHGAKFLHSMGLESRDRTLIAAGLSFIKFLEDERLVDLQ